ncbi:MAG: hypothetical protein IPM79_31530 [Polyangiaceae bacterium]|nr:hypothetical protein [Polyangiaceae bacterium]
MAKGETADARRSIARVIAQVMSDCPIEPTSVVEDLAEVLTFLDSAEYAEELAHEEL